MKTLKLTAEHFEKRPGEYGLFYIGTESVTDFNGSIEIDANIGWCRFASRLAARGSIIAKAGSGIEAGDGIEAGWGIEAGDGIKAGWGIEAGKGIKAGRFILCIKALKAGYCIFAGVNTRKRVMEDADKTVTCGSLEGKLEYGTLKLLKNGKTL